MVSEESVDRKHPSIFFCLQRNTSFIKPSYGICSKKLVKGFLNEILTPGISLAHFRYIKQRMGNITPSSP